MNQLFSLVIPAHNSENYIQNCLNSVIKQKFSNKKYEIIVINDASKDKTSKICKRFKEKNKYIRILNNKRNLGVSYSRNKGIEKAKGKYIVFLDSDDQLKKNSLKNLEKMLLDGDVDLLLALESETSLKKVDSIIFDMNKKNDFFKFINSSKNFKSHSWNFIINKNFAKKNNIYFTKIKIFEDQIFTTKILLNARKIKLYKKQLHNHIERFASLGRLMDFSALMSSLKVINEMCKMLKNKYLTPEQEKFLIIRINFMLIFFKVYFLLINDQQVKKISLYVKKNFQNLLVINKMIKGINFTIKNLLLLKKKTILNIQSFNFKKFESIYIFGTGIFGRATAEILKQNGINIKAFFDNNSYFHNEIYLEKKVLNPRILKHYNPIRSTKILILVCHNDKRIIRKIYNQLRKYGLKNDNVRIINWKKILK